MPRHRGLIRQGRDGGLISGFLLMGMAALGLLDAYFENLLLADSLLMSFFLVMGGLMTAYFGNLVRLKAKLKRIAP